MPITDNRRYTAEHEGRHLSMTVLSGHQIVIHESRYLLVGQSMGHRPGATILLVVGPVDREG